MKKTEAYAPVEVAVVSVGALKLALDNFRLALGRVDEEVKKRPPISVNS